MNNKYLRYLLSLFFLVGVGNLGFGADAPAQAQSTGTLELQDIANLQDGDLIFIQSTSSQSAALRESTQSVWTHVGIAFRSANNWTVAEAANGVRINSLSSFIAKSRGGAYIVKRINPTILPMSVEQVSMLKNQVGTFLGLPYDVWFEWSDSYIYCSELVWKAYYQAFGLEVGTLQVMGDLRLDGPETRKLIRERYINQGRRLNLNEPIISPVQMLNSPLLETVQAN